MRFRFWTLLWVMALFASAYFAFDILGILLATSVASLWYFDVSFGVKTSGLAGVLLIGVICSVFPTLSTDQPTCTNNLRQIALAIQGYHDSKGHFPVAQTTVDGKPGHSWRTQIIPYIESTEFYEKVNFDESWDTPTNEQVFPDGVELFRCPRELIKTNRETSYLAVVDPRTMWPPDRPSKFADIKDGTANTIMLIEVHDRDIQWPEPRDLTFEEALKLLTKGPGHESNARYGSTYGTNVVFADGTVSFVAFGLDPEFATALLTCAGGEVYSFLTDQSEHGHKSKSPNFLTVFIFAIISVSPAVAKIIGTKTDI